ncbi:uncharacterized protein LOC108908944 [Anoplophora glabripennis]|nr:uncharacterized protein LOC108908944 [Anoplophora glabripennis]
MKKLLLLFVVIFTYAYADEESLELSSSEEESIGELVTLLETKLNSTIFSDILVLINKTESRCPGIEEKLDKAVGEVGECLDDIDLGEDTICTVTRKNLEKCSEPITKILVDCLPEESKGLPILGIKILKAVLDQACNSTVEEILELLNACTLKKEFDYFDTCTSLKNTFQQYRDKVPSKSLVCSLMPNVKSCIKSHQEASCKNPVTRAVMVKFYDAIDIATASECQELNKVK